MDNTKEIIQEQTNINVTMPKMYKVILHNDDFTPMDFVVFILRKIFKKSEIEATKIMMTVHKNGKGVAGIYPRDVAMTKAAMVGAIATKNGFPLKASIEREE